MHKQFEQSLTKNLKAKMNISPKRKNKKHLRMLYQNELHGHKCFKYI